MTIIDADEGDLTLVRKSMAHAYLDGNLCLEKSKDYGVYQKPQIIEEELIDEIKSYNNFFSPNVINYLLSLVTIENNVLNNLQLSNHEIEILYNTSFFSKLINYNLYHSLLSTYKNIMAKNNLCLDDVAFYTDDNPNILYTLALEVDAFPHEEFDVFNFSEEDGCYEIALYQTVIATKEKREKFIEHFKDEYEFLKSCRYKEVNRMNELETLINSLKNPSNIEENSFQIEIQEKFIKEFLKYFNLNSSNFRVTLRDDLIEESELCRSEIKTKILRETKYI